MAGAVRRLSNRTQMTNEFVFQYGSNMSRTRMLERISEAQPIEAAWTVEAFEFTFPVWSKQANRAASGIVPSASGRPIFGVLFSIPSDPVYRQAARPGRKTLDEFEGEGSNYVRAQIAVVGATSQQRLNALTYLPAASSWKAPTNAEYANYILTGLSEWNAPDDYVRYVQGVIARALVADTKGRAN